MATETGAAMQRVCLGMSAATGGVVAVLSDIVQKHEASATEQVRETLGQILGTHTPYLWVAALLLIALAVILSFIFGSDSNKSAFTTGLGILAFVVTVTPYKAVPNLDTTPAAGTPTTASTVGFWDRLMIPSRVYAQNTSAQASSTPFTIHLDPADKKPVGEAVYTLVDSGTGQAVRRSHVQGSELSFYVDNRSYLLRVQVDGYQIAEVPLNPPARQMTIPLKPSSVPLSIQHLFRR